MTCVVSGIYNANINSRPCNFMGSKPAMTLKKVSETLCSDFFEKQISPFDNPLIYEYLSKDSKKLDEILTSSSLDSIKEKCYVTGKAFFDIYAYSGRMKAFMNQIV